MYLCYASNLPMPMPPPAYTEKNLSFLEFAVPAQGLVFIFRLSTLEMIFTNILQFPCINPTTFYKLFSKYLS
jgi:hypothetical protein